MTSWSSYLRLTETMLELAERERWRELDRANEERLALQEELRAVEVGDGEREGLVRCLERCLELNDRIVYLAARAREQRVTRLQRAQLGGQAVAAYRKAEALSGPATSD